jgi:hypothetical protein
MLLLRSSFSTTGERSMPDDKDKKGPPDRSRINVHEPYELAYWTKHFGVTADRLRECVKKVGPMVNDVKRCLGK